MGRRDPSLVARLGNYPAATKSRSRCARHPIPARVEHRAPVSAAFDRVRARLTLICEIVAIGNPACFHAATPPSRKPSRISMPTRASLIRASSSCESDPAISTGCADNPSTVPAHDANWPDKAMFTDPGTWPAANSSPDARQARFRLRPARYSTQTAHRPQRWQSDKAGAPARLISASLRKYSGRAGRLLVNCATNSSLLLICSA